MVPSNENVTERREGQSGPAGERKECKLQIIHILVASRCSGSSLIYLRERSVMSDLLASWYLISIISKSPHNHLRQQLLRPGHHRPAAEQCSHIVKLQHIRLTLQLRRIINPHTILHKRCVATGITWLMGIDRYIKKSTASAA
jgi:hypothetical protein